MLRQIWYNNITNKKDGNIMSIEAKKLALLRILEILQRNTDEGSKEDTEQESTLDILHQHD